MIQEQNQVITVLLISENDNTVQNFLNRMNTNKLQNKEKVINLYYKQIDLNNQLDCIQQLSIFEYAILFIKDLEFHQYTLDNYNFRMLKLLQYYNYKQVFLIYDEHDNNQNDTQLKNMYSWINQEVIQIFNDERFNEQQEQNQLAIPLPEIQTQSYPNQNDILDFFKYIDDQQNHDLILAVIQNNNEQKGTAYIINGFILSGQTVIYQEQDALQKVQIKNFVDYFSKQEKNYAQKGDVIEYQFDLKKKIGGLLFGLHQDKYLVQIKDVKANVVCPVNVEKGGIQKFQKSDSKAFFFGIEMHIEKKKILGQLIGYSYVEMKQFTTKVFGITFRFSKQLYLTPAIIEKNLPFVIIKNKNFPATTIFCAKILSQDLICLTKVQVPKQKVVLIPQLTTPAIESMVHNGVDYRQRCRVCRTEQVRYGPTKCGHLRYCVDCKDICIESKLCLYCDVPCESVQSFNTHLTKQPLQGVKQLIQKQFIEYFVGNPQKEMLPFMIINNEINVEQNVLYEVNCENCDSLITHYSICSNKHQTLLCNQCQIDKCKTCQSGMEPKVEICYKYKDDPIE